ncbi:hypothetical protein NEOLEDRAFT_1240068 [Neolentinus lepideus HHB14362 ss-1]|uniref:Uncharacterized protein n=1 Tax=Neolentinus lepideus HHB14362 ss-1 TaxID=1314782 RepID=A0A165UC89_9AGAM|nr:hypothetical protein NEOLEDRAFT_1240068 [Neolentinus lepideus HHB14362 ss-1]
MADPLQPPDIVALAKLPPTTKSAPSVLSMAKFGPRHFVAPVAAFSMAIVVVLYVRYSIRTARAESAIRSSRNSRD